MKQKAFILSASENHILPFLRSSFCVLITISNPFPSSKKRMERMFYTITTVAEKLRVQNCTFNYVICFLTLLKENLCCFKVKKYKSASLNIEICMRLCNDDDL